MGDLPEHRIDRLDSSFSARVPIAITIEKHGCEDYLMTFQTCKGGLTATIYGSMRTALELGPGEADAKIACLFSKAQLLNIYGQIVGLLYRLGESCKGDQAKDV